MMLMLTAVATPALLLGGSPALRLAPINRFASPVTMRAEEVPQRPLKQLRDSEKASLNTAGLTGGVARTKSKAPPKQGTSVTVSGGSLKTWSPRAPSVEQMQVLLSSEGGQIDADIELWQGPSNSPYKMRVYVEDGRLSPFKAMIETPRGPGTVAIRNLGPLEFPIVADVVTDRVELASPQCAAHLMPVQGGAMKTFDCGPSIDSVQVLLVSDGRPLNARIELLQGPNNVKQAIELYTEDGRFWPFFCILETPGNVNVVRVLNTAPMEFPMAASVVPHSVSQKKRAMSAGRAPSASLQQEQRAPPVPQQRKRAIGASFVGRAPPAGGRGWGNEMVPVMVPTGSAPAAGSRPVAAAGPGPAVEMPPLAEAAAEFVRELGVEGDTIVEKVDAACGELGIETAGKVLADKAAECWTTLNA